MLWEEEGEGETEAPGVREVLLWGLRGVKEELLLLELELLELELLELLFNWCGGGERRRGTEFEEEWEELELEEEEELEEDGNTLSLEGIVYDCPPNGLISSVFLLFPLFSSPNSLSISANSTFKSVPTTQIAEEGFVSTIVR